MASRRGGVFVPITTEFNSKGLKEANKQLGDFGKTFSKSFAGIGATLGGAFAVGAITDQVGQMISRASDLNESMSKSQVVFGKSAKSVQDWSATAVMSMGMTQQAALEAAGTYGNLFQSFGLGRDQATAMSTSLVQLAADLASFNNTSVDEAIQALRSGLSGETEPLKRYGIAINDNRLKQEALNQKIYDGKGILNSAQKAQAAYALVMKDSALAQGDFKRTADGAANTMKSLTAAFEQSQAIIGGALLTSIMDLGNALGGRDGAVDGMTHLANGIAEIINQSADGVKAITAIYEALRKQAGAAEEGSIQQRLWNGYLESAVEAVKRMGGGPIFMLGGAYEKLARKTHDSSTAINRYKYDLQEQAAAARESANGSSDAAGGIAKVEKKAVKATTAIERLKAQLDRLQGKVSIKRQRLDLADLLDEGPGKSGRRTVIKDGKKKEVSYTTERDRKRFALDVQEARSDLALSLFESGGKNEAARKRARRQFALGRENVSGLGLGDYTQGLFSVPAELLKTNSRAARRVGDYEASKMGTVYIETMTVNVPTVAEALEQAKKAARLKGLNRGAVAALAG